MAQKSVSTVGLDKSEVLLCRDPRKAETAEWVRILEGAGVKVQVWNPSGDERDFTGVELPNVEFCYISRLCIDITERVKLPNLKALQCMGQGTAHVLARRDLLEGYRCFRTLDPARTERMAFWCLWAVLNCQRSCEEYRARQAERRWDDRVEVGRFKDNRDFSVGVLGQGALGGPALELLLRNGYKASAWTRTPKALPPGATCFAGREGLKPFLQQVDVAICLLPLTDETTHLINKETLSWMPKGSYLVNSSRGKIVNQEDLLAALDSGHLAGAVLDVTDPEPLPAEHPLWVHPHVRIFPHRATVASEGVEDTVQCCMRLREKALKGEPIDAVYELDWEKGYCGEQ